MPVLTLASGSAFADDEPAAKRPTPVEIVHPVARDVTDHDYFTGRLEPSASVRLKARVTGYLERIGFAEGDRVKKGDLLFEIDPRPYKAELQKAEAGVTLASARLEKAESLLKRAAALVGEKVVTKNEVDLRVADRREAQAHLAVARATLDHAALNLAFTRVHAPLDGRIGRRSIDVGGLVRADETDLAIVTVDGPMHAYFDIDERTFLELRLAAGKEGKGLRVALGLANEADLPRKAEVNYLDNLIDPQKGTIRLRATLPNADGTLLPGLSVRVRMTTGKPYKAQMVPTSAFPAGRVLASGWASGPRKSVVLVVNKKDEVEEREVVLGSRQGDMVAVREGLKPDDRVIIARRTPPKAGTKVEPFETKKAASGEK
jgi:RND family efflux transporter MFP subunit